MEWHVGKLTTYYMDGVLGGFLKAPTPFLVY